MINNILQKNEIKLISKPVEDINTQVIPLIENMTKLCNQQVGRFKTILALAHCQIEKENPLTFFVYYDGTTIVNPEIIEGSEQFMHQEGCASYCFRPEKKVKRYNRIFAKYTSVSDNKIEYLEKEIIGINACIFQHEIDHFKNKYIY